MGKTTMKTAAQKEKQLGKWVMWACCTIMLPPLVGYLIVAQTSITSAGLINAALPLGFCVGMHLVMHKMMGKSCHAEPAKIPTTEQKDAT